MKRQYTKTIFVVRKHKDTGMMCRLIKNKSKGKPFDVIAFTIFPLKGEPLTFNASPEEALEIVWGLTKTVWHFLQEFEPYAIWRSQKSESKWSNKKIWCR